MRVSNRQKSLVSWSLCSKKYKALYICKSYRWNLMAIHNSNNLYFMNIDFIIPCIIQLLGLYLCVIEYGKHNNRKRMWKLIRLVQCSLLAHFRRHAHNKQTMKCQEKGGRCPRSHSRWTYLRWRFRISPSNKLHLVRDL